MVARRYGSGQQAVLGAVLGLLGGRAMVYVLNHLNLAQGLHAPFVAAGVIVIFGLASVVHGSGFLAVYLAGPRGRQPADPRAQHRRRLPRRRDLARPDRDVRAARPAGLAAAAAETLLPALAIAATLMLIARPVAVFLCLWPFRFPGGKRRSSPGSACAARSASFSRRSRCWSGVPNAYRYFDIAFVVVLTSLLIQGWTIAPAARRLGVSFPRGKPLPRRVELDLPGQLEQEIVGYPVVAKSPYLRRGLIPAWAKPTLIVRDERILTAAERLAGARGRLSLSAGAARKGGGARPLLRRHAAAGRARPAAARRLLRLRRRDAQRAGRDLRAVGRRQATPAMSLADFFADELKRTPRQGDIVPLGSDRAAGAAGRERAAS